MNIKTLGWVFAAVFLAVGALGFVPAATPEGHLLGIFHVDALHNIIHLASGAAAVIALLISAAATRWYFRIFGVVYGLVAAIGFWQGTTVLGLFPVNMEDNLLHIAIAVSALAIGFFAPGEDDQPVAAPAPMGTSQSGMM